MYAIIETGGKQYRVQQGDVIFVEKLDKEPEGTIDFDVILLGTDDGVKVGKPIVEGAKVQAKVVAQVKGEKILVFKYKSKKNYRRRKGHRQAYTKLEVVSVNG